MPSFLIGWDESKNMNISTKPPQVAQDPLGMYIVLTSEISFIP